MLGIAWDRCSAVERPTAAVGPSGALQSSEVVEHRDGVVRYLDDHGRPLGVDLDGEAEEAFSRRARSTSRPAAVGPSASRSSTRPGAVLVAAVTDVRRVSRHSSVRSVLAPAVRVQAIGTCTLQR